MTFLATWPSSTAGPADCRAFDSEHAAEVCARAMTAAGHPRVVVFEVPDDRIDPPARPLVLPESDERCEVAPMPTRHTNGPQIDAERFEESA